MAFFLNNTTFGTQLQSHFKTTQADALSLSRRQYHIELGPREKALLAEDPVLKRFKSHKKTVSRIKGMGDILTIVVVAGCCYEIYVRAVMREQARNQAKVVDGST